MNEGLLAQSKIYVSESQLLIQSIEEIAQRWRGWENEIEWTSIDSDLSFSATYDKRCHIMLAVYLGGVSDITHHPQQWSPRN